MKRAEIQSLIDELELELEELERGDYSYDVVDAELQSLYHQLHQLEGK